MFNPSLEQTMIMIAISHQHAARSCPMSVHGNFGPYNYLKTTDWDKLCKYHWRLAVEFRSWRRLIELNYVNITVDCWTCFALGKAAVHATINRGNVKMMVIITMTGINSAQKHRLITICCVYYMYWIQLTLQLGLLFLKTLLKYKRDEWYANMM